jgi:hypothetical protein
LQVELVQLEQMAMLRCLIKHHGLSRFYKEGLTAEDTAFPDKIETMKEAHGLQPCFTKQLDEVRQMQKQMAAAGKENSDRWQKTKIIEKELIDLIDQHAADKLVMGAAVRLLITGELAAALPLDDVKLLEAAKPVSPDGRIQFDAAKVKAREDGMVRIALAKDTIVVLILGGSHDLTGSIRAFAGEGCEYMRLTSQSYGKISGDGFGPEQ